MRVDRWIEKANRRFAIGCQLLVDQRDKAGPHGRGKAGSSVKVRGAAALVRADVKGEIRVRRYVRPVAQGRRAMVAGIDHA